MNLAEKYRPTRLEDIAGQDAAIAQVRAVLARGWGAKTWWITGTSGSGKTSFTRIIASLGAADLGIEEIDAGTLTPARLREIEGEMRFRNLGAKPGKAYLVNEAHGLRKDTIRQLLVALERLPDYVTWIFTTTKSGQAKLFDDDAAGDAAPLLSRCIEVTLEADTKAFAARARTVAMAEGIDGLPLSVYESAVAASGNNLRRVLNRIESGVFTADARSQMADQLTEVEREYAMVAATKGSAAADRRASLDERKAALKAGIEKLSRLQ